MRLLIIQYTGDYRETVRQFSRGGSETYYAQKYSIDAVAKLTAYADQVAFLCCITTEVYEEALPNGVCAIGGGFQPGFDARQLIPLIERYSPTHLVLGTVLPEVLKWAIQKNIPTLTTFANSIPHQGFVRKLKNIKIVRLLNQPQIEWIGSYGLNSSQNLQRMGVKPEKIIPWDFLIDVAPGGFSPKSLSAKQTPWQLCYVGSISEEKGVGDILAAVADLKAKQFPVLLKLVGQDSAGYAAEHIAKLDIADSVEQLGILSNAAIEPLMHESDVVLVPSRHEYVEGFPLVIHHALRACTPIVASDHPMFRNYLQHRVSAMIFPQANVAALSACIQELLTTPALYNQISQKSHPLWMKLRLPIKWADLLSHWVKRTKADQQVLASYSLTAHCYSID